MRGSWLREWAQASVPKSYMINKILETKEPRTGGFHEEAILTHSGLFLDHAYL